MELQFGSHGNSQPFLGCGWSFPEDGFTWTEGLESQALLPAPARASAFALEVDVAPFVMAQDEVQRLAILVNDEVVGLSEVRAAGALAFPIPAHALAANSPIHVRFLHPDAARPRDRALNADPRLLAFRFRSLRLMPVTANDPLARAPALPAQVVEAVRRIQGEVAARARQGVERLMLEFHSLGHDCEFGLVQRHFGVEPLDLLRFASVPMPALVDGIEAGLEGLGDPGQIALDTLVHPDQRREIAIRDRRYGFVYHTFVLEDQPAPSDLLERERSRLRFKKRKFLEDVLTAQRIFVRTLRPGVDTVLGALPLYQALVRHGANTLLCVTLADARHAPGTVELSMPGLLVGYVDDFYCLRHDRRISYDLWLELCRRAVELRAGR